MPLERHPLRPLLACAILCSPAASLALPPPDSGEFCIEVQKILADTDLQGDITVFTDMPAYRHSKPMVEPLAIFQVVSYAGKRPIMVSCKVKTAAHLRAAHGAEAAGEQRFCADITRRVQAQAVEELRQSGQEAAARAAAGFVVEENEPYTTGRSYLADFQLSFLGADGRIHLNSPGLFQDYDSWVTMLLPERFQGQSYCHIASVDYIKALATGEMAPGTVMTTADDAPVTPLSRPEAR